MRADCIGPEALLTVMQESFSRKDSCKSARLLCEISRLDLSDEDLAAVYLSPCCLDGWLSVQKGEAYIACHGIRPIHFHRMRHIHRTHALHAYIARTHRITQLASK